MWTLKKREKSYSINRTVIAHPPFSILYTYLKIVSITLLSIHYIHLYIVLYGYDKSSGFSVSRGIGYTRRVFHSVLYNVWYEKQDSWISQVNILYIYNSYTRMSHTQHAVLKLSKYFFFIHFLNLFRCYERLRQSAITYTYFINSSMSTLYRS